MHIKLTNGVPEKYTIGQLRRDNPQVSFPKSIPDSTLAEYDVYPLKPTERPEYDPMTQRVEEGPPELISDVWQQTWNIINLSADEIELLGQEQANAARSKRDQLLAETDWVAIRAYEQGSAVSSEWNDYRQQLRDITAQPGFPYEIIWPTRPQN